mmetsp:Transcript_66902/g.149288  ORF Transcript_66902/g.149288 Transcript_66902/m.149288 type:complete len:280 (-) Transcript_66902:354-1193(-)
MHASRRHGEHGRYMAVTRPIRDRYVATTVTKSSGARNVDMSGPIFACKQSCEHRNDLRKLGPLRVLGFPAACQQLLERRRPRIFDFRPLITLSYTLHECGHLKVLEWDLVSTHLPQHACEGEHLRLVIVRLVQRHFRCHVTQTAGLTSQLSGLQIICSHRPSLRQSEIEKNQPATPQKPDVVWLDIAVQHTGVLHRPTMAIMQRLCQLQPDGKCSSERPALYLRAASPNGDITKRLGQIPAKHGVHDRKHEHRTTINLPVSERTQHVGMVHGTHQCDLL